MRSHESIICKYTCDYNCDYIYIFMRIKKAFYACEFVFVCSVSRYVLLVIDTSSRHVKGFSLNMGSTVQKEP